jgi:ATP-dependent Lon protease
MPKRDNRKTNTKAMDNKRKRKIVESSDSDSDSSYHPDSDSENEMDELEYKKFLAKMFPSKHMDKKVKNFKKAKKNLEKEEEEDEYETMSEGEDDETLGSKDSDTEREGEDEDDDDMVQETTSPIKANPGQFNIILSIGPGKKKGSDMDDDESEEWFNEEGWDSQSDTLTENEDEEVSDPEDSDSDREDKKELSKKEQIVTRSKSKKDNNEVKPVKDKKVLETETELTKALEDLQKMDKNNPIINNCIKECEEKLNKKHKLAAKREKKQKAKNDRIFRKILKDKNTLNDFEFFDKMDVSGQKKVIKELREVNKATRIQKPYRLTLLESDIPTVFKGHAMKKINALRYMEPGSGEYHKIKTWVDGFMRIPFGKYSNLPISIDDGVEKCHDFMENAKKVLDEAVYGLNDAKMQVMQLVGQLITNPSAIGSSIAIHGPPGTGKTSIVKEGISKILGRPFAFIALGGATDSSFLEGHGYTYEGSMWGRIVQILIDSKCMNPVIYFDELDKISETPKGEEIAGILTHLTDTSQNSQFHDKYFADIDFDLSKCLFIFSYNDESKVNPILRDRMYRIQTKGYDMKQKTVITNDYLLPRLREQVRFTKEEIVVPDNTIQYIIDNYCNKENGVRNLKRCLEIVYTKLNLYRLMKPGSNLFEQDMSLKVEFPFTVTKDIVDKLIKINKDASSSSLYMLYV